MIDRTLLGVLTPSSNTRLEPLTSRMLAGLPDVSAHFSRLRVLDVSLAPEAVNRFEAGPMLAAAELLADAQVDVIVWSGTSGAWKGLDADRQVCTLITEHTGIPSTTSTLALVEALELAGASNSLGLVTPYPDDMQAVIESTLSSEGMTVTASATHAVTTSNWALSEISAETIGQLVKQVAAAGPAVISTFCTNLAAADHVERWEADFGIPVYDTVSLAVWQALRMLDIDSSSITGWGSLFSLR